MGDTAMCIAIPVWSKTTIMLPLLAVLFVAQSVVAAPSVSVSLIPVNQYPTIPDNGRPVNRYVVDGASGWIDSADMPFYAQMALQAVYDMADSGDVSSQAGSLVSTIAILGELVAGLPGDSCESAAFINAYAYAASTGNNGGLKQAASNYLSRLNTYIDLIVQLIVNPSSVKFSTGPRGTCLGGGRTYQFEQAWDGILNNSNAFQIGLLNEIYCAARRMYRATSATSNNVASALTAVSAPIINNAAQIAMPDLANLMRTVANGNNPTQAAAIAKASLAQALSKVSV
ncbi:fibroin light chain-like [Epargyreus clarus]|uniref:fibroin light chain-like n=1 Tax=Epargyreus clarus TaxID=520877 RepID=UPI003C2EEA34